MMYFHDVKKRITKELTSGVHARTFWGDKIMLAVVELEANSMVPLHSHPHEQAGIVLEGQLEFTIADETKTVHSGDVYLIPGGVEHGVKVGSQPARVMDVFTPVREEYKY